MRRTEQEYLRACLKRIDQPHGTGIFEQRWFPFALGSGVLLAAAALVSVRHRVDVETTMVASLLLGVCLAYGVIRAGAAHLWPLLAKYLNREALERRLRELESA